MTPTKADRYYAIAIIVTTIIFLCMIAIGVNVRKGIEEKQRYTNQSGTMEPRAK